MKSKKTAYKRKYLAYLPILLILALILALSGVVYARYSYREGTNGMMHAKEFYFSSNLLDGGEHTLAPGSTEITFTIGNHEDALRYSETTISYSVKVNGATPSGTNLSGTLTAGAISDQQVTITGLVPGQSYEITAEGVGGYHQSLSAWLVVPVAENSLYKYLDTSNPGYVLLTVWSKGVKGDVVITAPSTVIPDNTDAVMRGAKTGDSFTDTVSFQNAGYGSHVYRFFGSGVEIGDFDVKCGGVTAVERVPS